MAVNPTKLLPPSGGALAVRSKTIDIGKKKEGGIEGQVLIIRTQVIKIEKLITRGYTLKLKEQKEKEEEIELKKLKEQKEIEEEKKKEEEKIKIMLDYETETCDSTDKKSEVIKQRRRNARL